MLFLFFSFFCVVERRKDAQTLRGTDEVTIADHLLPPTLKIIQHIFVPESYFLFEYHATIPVQSLIVC